jgi:hypothetical protein
MPHISVHLHRQLTRALRPESMQRACLATGHSAGARTPDGSSATSCTAKPMATAVSMARGDALVTTEANVPSGSPTRRASATPAGVPGMGPDGDNRPTCTSPEAKDWSAPRWTNIRSRARRSCRPW